ncbi:hypothetical protein EON65_39960 [archaeon]|nr:MAG: hypothetical protein EON65_39960 [archaeon]
MVLPGQDLPPLTLEEGSKEDIVSPTASIEAPSRSRRNSAVSFSEPLPVIVQRLSVKGVPKSPKGAGKVANGGVSGGAQATSTPPSSAGSKKRGGKVPTTPVRPGSPLSLSTNGLREWFMTQGKEGK